MYPHLYERVMWAMTKPKILIKTPDNSIKVQTKRMVLNEKTWGNSMINQTNNGQWTTLLGEQLVFDVLSHTHKSKQLNGAPINDRNIE